MQGLYLSQGELSYRRDLTPPQPEPGEALIRTRLAGICATDLELVKGYGGGFEGVLGHEFVGEVTAVGAETDRHWVGQRVVGGINLGCGACAVCRVDGPEHCSQRIVLGIHAKDGVFAECFTLPVSNLLSVPDEVADEQAVFTEPLAAALRIREQVKVTPTVKTAVVGPGRLGLLVGQVLALDGGDVIMLGRRKASLTLPAQLGFATGLVDQFAADSFDFVVEATGNESGFVQSLRLVRPLGTLILKSTFQGKTNLDLTKLVVGEINVVGSRCGPFAPALRLLQRGAVQVTPFIEGRYLLQKGLAAFEHAGRPGVLKILLQPTA